MKNYFLDTNVLLDWLLGRKPFFENAREIIRNAEDHHCNVYASGISISTITYFLQRSFRNDDVKKKLRALLSVIEVLPSSKHIFSQALSSSFRDLEDGYQYFTVMEAGLIDSIITRNTSDYKHSTIPILLPSELMEML